MNDWNIQSRAHACQACGKHFADKEVYHTLLFEQRSELNRQDICLSCWDKEKAHPSPERQGHISQWQGIYHQPPAAPPDPIQKETAETLLRKLIEANDPKHGPACFILAVMLERKRLLKVKEQIRRSGTRIFIYEHPKTGDLFTITDPNLQLNQLDDVQRDVADLLANGFQTPPAPVQEKLPLPDEQPDESAPMETTAPSPERQPETTEPSEQIRASSDSNAGEGHAPSSGTETQPSDSFEAPSESSEKTSQDLSSQVTGNV